MAPAEEIKGSELVNVASFSRGKIAYLGIDVLEAEEPDFSESDGFHDLVEKLFSYKRTLDFELEYL